MKVTVEYTLPEDKDEYETSVMAMDMYCTLFDIDNYLRLKIKHTDLTDDGVVIAEFIRNEISNLPMDRVS